MTYISFLKSFRYFTLFGLLLTFFSSFGQTFFISLFVPYIREAFNLDNSGFGLIYSAATVCSAITLIWAGKWIDTVHLKKYVLSIILLLVCATLLMSVAWAVPLVFLSLYGIRLGFQGLLSHTSQTTMARFFNLNRGKALSLANLGYPIGEAILPVLGLLMIGWLGWRFSWVFIAGIILCVMLPVMLFLLKQIPDDPTETLNREGTDTDSISEKVWTRRMVLADLRFYIILPAFISSPFLLTGLFLFQLDLAGYKGWSPELLASAFILFAGGRILFSLIGGPLIDRFTARKMFPFMLLPMSAGLLILNSGNAVIIPFLYMFSLGITEGLASGVKNALWAEIYGIRALGTVRSLMAFIIILSTALSPFLFGWLLDNGITFTQIVSWAFIWVIGSCLLSLRILKKDKK